MFIFLFKWLHSVYLINKKNYFTIIHFWFFWLLIFFLFKFILFFHFDTQTRNQEKVTHNFWLAFFSLGTLNFSLRFSCRFSLNLFFFKFYFENVNAAFRKKNCPHTITMLTKLRGHLSIRDLTDWSVDDRNFNSWTRGGNGQWEGLNKNKPKKKK